eukprot:COSAG02_NODE_54520_length_295_cov_1.581633_1_plen_77_part_10
MNLIAITNARIAVAARRLGEAVAWLARVVARVPSGPCAFVPGILVAVLNCGILTALRGTLSRREMAFVPALDRTEPN